MSKHTPGPWKRVFSPFTACGRCHLIKQDDSIERLVACLWEGGGTKGKPTQLANVRLITAAPLLLKALKKVESMTVPLIKDVPTLVPKIKEIARQAISKAERGYNES